MDLESAYHTLLEQRLDRALLGKRVEFLNFGVGGYSLANELAVLERRALAYEPDRVLVGKLRRGTDLHSREFEIVTRLAREEEIRLIDTGPAFQGVAFRDTVVSRMDPHPNAAAHARFAAALEDGLLELEPSYASAPLPLPKRN